MSSLITWRKGNSRKRVSKSYTRNISPVGTLSGKTAHAWKIWMWGSLNVTAVLRVHHKAFKYSKMNEHPIFDIILLDQQFLSCFLNLAHSFPCFDHF